MSIIFVQIDFASPTSQQEFFDALEASCQGDDSRKEEGAHDSDRKERRRIDDGDQDMPVQMRRHHRGGEEKDTSFHGIPESVELKGEGDRSRRRHSKGGDDDWMNGGSKYIGKEQMDTSSADLMVTVTSFSAGSERSVSRMKEKEGRGKVEVCYCC